MSKRLNLVIKIGTAALTGKGGTGGLPDAALLAALAAEFATLKAAGHSVILVTSGAVGTGRALAKDLRCDPTAARQILAGIGQPRLMELYRAALAPHQLDVAQILLTKSDFRTRAHHAAMTKLFGALRAQKHVLPVVNENDSVTPDVFMFTDNDELAGLLAATVNADRLIILSHIAGVYDRPPEEDGARIIPLIDRAKTGAPLTKGKSKSGRGGMSGKLATAKKMASLGIPMHIADAREPGIITRLLRDEGIGTKVAAAPARRNAVKRWLAHEIDAASASVTANTCLATMMRDPVKAFSLLPVGLIKIEGRFGKGDLVRIVDEAGAALALGVARYDDVALKRALGKKQQPVFIHYDQLHRVEDE